MDNEIALLLSDGYKQVHAEQFPEGLTRLVSYITPRKSRLKYQDSMVLFGVQAFCKTYLIDYFNKNFFNVDIDTVVREYTRVLDIMLGKGNYGVDKIKDLHKLGYLPIEISAVAEGSIIPMKVPCVEITNTHEDFAWVVQWVESLFSSEFWKPCIQANVGYEYRKVVNKWYDLTVDNNIPKKKAMSDFGFRGMSCLQEAVKASASWLLSFSSTATIPTIPYLEKMYNCDCEVDEVGCSAISTEHSVMCSNYTVDGDEISMVKRLLTEIYPNSNFSMVADSYDYWNMIENILPSCKEEIFNHNGKLLVRPDSGDIVEISVATVERLYDLFGGTLNSKGYKVLHPKIGVIYGDGVTIEKADKIYSILESRGYASNTIIFGCGSFSFNCIEEDGVLNPLTRDTFSIAIKSTYGEIYGKSIDIFKNPKTDTDNFKKSQKGCCVVSKNVFTGGLFCIDGFTYRESKDNPYNLFTTVFKDGKMVKEYTLNEVRNRLHKGEF